MISLEKRRLYLCTNARSDIEDFLAQCIDGGVDIVQLREKDLEARGLFEMAARCQAVCAERSVPFIMNDRPDLALALGADGVHVGQDDVTVDVCRAILGDDAIIGLSTHASDELAAAISERVTYLSAGPIEATPTKPGRPGTGIAYATEAVGVSPVPVFVTGGVTAQRVPELVAAGVEHFVVVRALTHADDPYAAAKALRRAIDAEIGD